jgi:diguanylate cyclase (GGDEF)-like protein
VSDSLARQQPRLVTTTSVSVAPDAATSRLAAARSLVRVEVVEEAVGICIALVRALGGWTIPARLDDGHALPIDCSFGHGEPLLPVAANAVSRRQLEQILPEVLEDAREAIARIRQRDDLGQQARTDPLTGLLNRRAIDVVLGRLRPDDVILIIDLDDFKRVNDTRGHSAGDEVLLAFSRVLRDRSRPGDHVARVGGDELLAVLTATDELALTTFLERLRSTWLTVSPHAVTYSAGAAWVGDRTAADVLAAADAALYIAKDGGRDRVVIEPALTAIDAPSTTQRW